MPVKEFKLAKVITDAPECGHGECKIDIEKVVKLWNTQKTFISRYDRDDEQYRLCDDNGFKATISKEDAESIIEKLDLVQVQIKPFAHAWSYMTKERRDRFEAAMKVPDLVMELMQSIYLHKQQLDEKERKQYFKSLKQIIKTLE